MKFSVLSLPTMEELCQHVHATLCAHDGLDPKQSPLQKSLMQRRGQTCGMFFQVNGPRLVKVYPVWAGNENRILCYDSRGQRFAEMRLIESPDPRKLAA